MSRTLENGNAFWPPPHPAPPHRHRRQLRRHVAPYWSDALCDAFGWSAAASPAVRTDVRAQRTLASALLARVAALLSWFIGINVGSQLPPVLRDVAQEQPEEEADPLGKFSDAGLPHSPIEPPARVSPTFAMPVSSPRHLLHPSLDHPVHRALLAPPRLLRVPS